MQASRLGRVYSTPAWLTPTERVLLYGLVLGARPERSIEIGTLHGGSALLIIAALDDLGSGRLWCVEPEPRIDPMDWEQIRHRATLVQRPSPEGIEDAAERAGGVFGFALVDGDHGADAVNRDLTALLRTTDAGALVLLHDALNPDVDAGIESAIALGGWIDLGLLAKERTSEPDGLGRTVTFGGIRALRRAG